MFYKIFRNYRRSKNITIKNNLANIKISFIIIVLQCYAVSVMAQKFPKFTFTHINNYSQIPNQACSYVLKDRQGFLWISTYDGLCRYDGSNFTIYRNEPENINSIANNNTGTIAEDKEGNIWVSQLKGVSCYTPSTGKFRNYSSNPKDSNTVLGDLAVIHVDTAGNIFGTYGMGGELCKFNKLSKKFIPFSINATNDSFNNKGISNTIKGTMSAAQMDGSIYLMSQRGIFLFDTKTYKTTRVCDSSIYDPLSILKDHTGKLWLGEWHGGISIINETTKTKKNITGVLNVNKNKTDKKVFAGLSEYKDLNGKYWILAGEWSTGSIIVIDPFTEKIQYQLITVEGELNSNISAGTIFSAADGKVYITTGMAGLLEANPVRESINNAYTYERGKPADIFYDNLVRNGIQLDNSGYAFGLLEYNGIRFYDSNFIFKNAIKSFKYKGKNYDLDVRSFLRIDDNKYLLSGKTGIILLDKGVFSPILYSAKKNQSKDTIIKLIRDLLPINKEEYWVRMLAGGIKIFNLKTKLFTKEFKYADKRKKINLGNINKIFFDKTGRLWINNANTIYTYNKITDEFLKFPINKNGKFLSTIYEYCFDEANNLWITGDGGLLKYNFLTKKETLLTTTNGLINNITEKITVDKDNNIWLTYQTGISMLNTKTNEIRNYTVKDGLPLSRQEYDVAFFIDKYNNLIVGNSGVVTQINIDRLNKLINNNPKIIITAVQGADSTLSLQVNSKLQKQVKINFKDFPVSINFSIIDFSSNCERKYYYRYKGKDTAWIKTNNGSVSLNYSTPGTYTIEVTGKINSKESVNIDSITFTVLPRWFETWLFKIISVLLLLWVLIVLYRWRLKTVRNTESQRTEIQRLSAEQYKNQLELSQISNYFSSALKDFNTEEEVLWDVAKKLIAKLGFEDCMIYLWNENKTKLEQKAGYGPKGSIEEINKLPFDVLPGQGVVGHVALTKENVLIVDTSTDNRYRVDEMNRLSEICVPILYENEVLGIIDSEHSQKGFFTTHHLQLLTNIAFNIANKLVEITNKNALRKNKIELANTIQNLKGAQLDALRSQMNPHFIFNSLNSIENFILKNEKLIASEYLGKFSKLIRNILDNSKSEKIALEKEIETLQLYIELERIRTNNKFEVIFEIPDNILADNIMLPPMLMQPHAENAILHGLRHLEDKKGKLTVSINITNDECLEYTLEDNGIGRKKSMAQKSLNSFTHKSYGIDITKNRIDLYNQKNNINITYKIIDLYDGANKPVGTKIVIIIPLLQN